MPEFIAEETVVRRPMWRESDMELICGIANSGGGRIVITLPAGGQARKMRRFRKTFELIPRLAQTELGLSCTTEPVMDGTELCLEIIVPAATTPVSYQGTYYFYTNGENTIVDEGLLTSLFESEENATWEMQIQPFVRQEDLDDDMLVRMAQKLNVKPHGNIYADRNVSEALISYGMKDGHSNTLTNIGILLLHRAPQNFIPGAYVRIGIFDENDQEIGSPATVTGPLISQYEQVMNLLYDHFLPRAIEMQEESNSATHASASTLPPREAVSEAVRNALIHKDYDSALPIKISVYPSRLHIDNVGRPPATWSTEDLMGRHNSRPNNPALANALSMVGIFNGWGNGISSMLGACQRAGLLLPKLALRADETEVTFTLDQAVQNLDQDIPAKENLDKSDLEANTFTDNTSNEDAKTQAKETLGKEPEKDVEQTPSSLLSANGDSQHVDSANLKKEASNPHNERDTSTQTANTTASAPSAPNTPQDSKPIIEKNASRATIARPQPTKDRKPTFKERSVAAANRLNMTSTDEYVLKVIETNGRVTAVRIAEVLGVSESTVRRSFRRLREYGFIERIGSDKAGYWRLID